VIIPTDGPRTSAGGGYDFPDAAEVVGGGLAFCGSAARSVGFHVAIGIVVERAQVLRRRGGGREGPVLAGRFWWGVFIHRGDIERIGACLHGDFCPESIAAVGGIGHDVRGDLGRCAGLHFQGGYFIYIAFHHSFPHTSYLGEAVHVVIGAGGHASGGSGAEPVAAIVIRPGLGVKQGVGVGILAIVACDFIAKVIAKGIGAGHHGGVERAGSLQPTD
jgi:hypothetical protein